MNKYIILILTAIIFIEGWYLTTLKNKVSTLTTTNAKLEKNLKEKIELKKDKIIYIYRDKNSTKAITRDTYADGNVSIVTTNDNSNLNQNFWDKITTEVIPTQSTGTYIVIKHAGLVFAPAISCAYDFNKLLPGLESRVVFYRDFGVGIGGSLEYLYLFADYNLRILKLHNSYFGIFINSKKEPGIKLGVRL